MQKACRKGMEIIIPRTLVSGIFLTKYRVAQYPIELGRLGYFKGSTINKGRLQW